MSVLIVGRTGQVARALADRLPGAVTAGREQVDLERPATIAALVAAHRPTIIINAAAYTAVDAAEDDRDRAMAVNGTALATLGAAARDIGALVVHYSTDYVFDGHGETPFQEADAPRPLSVYGQSKLAGEVALAESGADHLTLRVSWVYSTTGRNFPLTMLRLARERTSLGVVADQVGGPTSADFIAAETIAAMTQASKDRALCGLYHLAPDGYVSWHGLAEAVLAGAVVRGAHLLCPPSAVRAITTADYPTKAVRPLNSRLDTGKFRTAFQTTLPGWQQDLTRFMDQLQTEGRL